MRQQLGADAVQKGGGWPGWGDGSGKGGKWTYWELGGFERVDTQKRLWTKLVRERVQESMVLT